MSRQEFSAKTKLAAWSRSAGACESCGNKIITVPEYDHATPCYFGGDNSLDNCRVLCRACHAAKSSGKEIQEISKSRRIRKAHAGIAKKKRKIPGSKGSGFRKKMDGTVIRVKER